MTVRSRLASVALVVIAVLLSTSGTADAQQRQRIARTPPGASPEFVIRCFVPNCGKCNTFNPYLCAECNVGYQLSAGFVCRSCQPGYEQNLDVQTFTCSKCPPGFTSNGGSGEASQCFPITATQARRLFQSDAAEDLWA